MILRKKYDIFISLLINRGIEMNKKILTLLLMACTSANASEKLNPGVTLLEHTETHGEVLPANLMAMAHSSSSLLSASAYAGTGYAGQQVKATGNANATIINQTSASQVYYVDKFMCIQGSSCLHLRDTYQLMAGSQQFTNSDMITAAYIASCGKYEDEVTIQISGAENNAAASFNTITVE
jgi:hypothetical protein